VMRAVVFAVRRPITDRPCSPVAGLTATLHREAPRWRGASGLSRAGNYPARRCYAARQSPSTLSPA
jgi:hypothetical protein